MYDTFYLKSKVYAGKGSIEQLRTLSGSAACVITDSIMDELGYLGKTIDLLREAGMETAVFQDVRPDPDTSVVAAGVEVFQASGADVLVALGGGSVIDAAKAVLYTAWKMDGAAFRKPQFIAIPSTSGTGSEVTDFSVITVDGNKIVIVDELISPDIAILDSICLQHVPNKVVADTGIDVLVHALEAYVSNKTTDFTDALAEKAVQLIFAHLPTLYRDPTDAYARDRVQNASCIAGMAFTNAFLGINHSLAHAFGGRFHIAHGRSNAMMMLPVMDYNAWLSGGSGGERERRRYAHLAQLLGLPCRTAREGTVSLMDAVRELKWTLEIPSSILELGVERDAFTAVLSDMADAALQDRCTPSAPRQPSKDELIAIYEEAYG
ncbi:MAG: iron-containing alcohol dehydrogenase [Oscillospiraceae bacterium]|nr:iron-containing alcohol dehydrogenase [Oscillospiraceae bacterium]